jgi:hypothetical protein
MRRATRLLKDLKAARLRIEREPRGRAENRLADTAMAAQTEAVVQETTCPDDLLPPNEATTISEPAKSLWQEMSTYNSWVTATQQKFESHTRNVT